MTLIDAFLKMVELYAVPRCEQRKSGVEMPFRIFDAALLVREKDLLAAKNCYDDEFLSQAVRTFVESQFGNAERPEWLPKDYWTRGYNFGGESND